MKSRTSIRKDWDLIESLTENKSKILALNNDER